MGRTLWITVLACLQSYPPSFVSMVWLIALATQVLCTVVYASSASSGSHRTFDYVVVGGGTAGLVVAARLSEDPHTTVAVIEAGTHHVNEPLVDTPGGL
ncbi:hypothetical protein BD311DRAFT_12890 [Dichomitus squalens]|uniref:Uncharacterized protein n=1 Tax=Dichomitus squalens TaxID=114155 RepID=A0A4Q9N517_9APHY|nr:hypothetical protein BD311DRAFT_12890 [Dichomitus squalens]